MDKAAPLLLGIETSTELCSVALFEGDRLLDCLEHLEDRAHARILSPMVDKLLKGQGIAPSRLSGVVVGQGPGSYTGLRVGVSAAKGICMALNIPLFAIDCLEGLAWSVRAEAEKTGALICPMTDARRMDVYAGIWDSDMNPVMPVKALTLGPEIFEEWFAGKPAFILGSGAKKAITVYAGHGIVHFDPDSYPSARHWGIPAFHLYQSQKTEDLHTFEPAYLKEFSTTVPKNKLL